MCPAPAAALPDSSSGANPPKTEQVVTHPGKSGLSGTGLAKASGRLQPNRTGAVHLQPAILVLKLARCWLFEMCSA